MKKHFIFLFTLLLPYFAAAQVVTTTPAFITRTYDGVVTVIFDATKGNGGMVGATQCFAHTGAMVAGSTNWIGAPVWRDGNVKYKMTSAGTNLWQLTISPNMQGFYGYSSSTVIEKLAFVFNDGPSGTKEGKNADGSDIYVYLYDAGLNVSFTTPNGNQLVNLGTNINFAANSSESANLELKINGASVKTQSGTSLTYSQTFSTAGDYKCVITATTGEETANDSLMICVAQPPTSANRPAGTLEGINYLSPTSAVLVMYAKDKNNVVADNVFVVGDFNDWAFSNEYQMKKDASNSGFFWLQLDNLVPNQEYGYQYAVKIGNNVIKISDAYSEKVLDGSNDKWITPDIYPDLKPFPEGKANGYVSVLETNQQPYNWSSQTLSFSGADKNNLVIYEMWIYDFSKERTIKEVIDRLDYLQNLGVNAIELMPITEFDGNISWGYNPNHFFAPDKAYGTPSDYKMFIDECHKRGMAVILDMVFNHATGNNPWAKLYWNGSNNVANNNPWFNAVLPPTDHEASVNQDFNHDFELTRNYFRRVLQYWITEYKIDGYRMDLSKGLCGANCNDRVDIINDYYNAAKAIKPNVYFILEHWGSSSEEQGYVNNGMLCWGGGSGMNDTYSQTAMGWLKPSDKGNSDNFSAAKKKGWVYYCESHDEQRNFFKAKMWGNGNLITDETARLNRVPLNVGFNVMLEGPKMLWQYEEMGYDFTICFSSGDPASQTANDGDHCYRTDSKPIPENLGWFQNSLRMGAYKKIAQMLELRKRFDSMFLNGTCTLTGGTGASARYVQWSYGTDKMVVAGNFNVDGGTQYTGSVTCAPFNATGTWYDYYAQTTLNVTSASQTITLAPGEIKIFTNTYQSLPNIPDEYDYTDVETVYNNNFDCTIFPTVTRSEIFVESSQNINRIDVYSLRSEKVMSIANKNVINVASLPSGLYLMVVTFDKRQEAFKFIRE